MKIIDTKHFCDKTCEKGLDNEISLVFQKIVSSTGKLSYEILSRIGNDFKSPEPILQKLCINNMRKFDYRVFDLIFSEFDKYIEKYGSIHINIFPFTLREHDFIENFKKYLSKYNITDTSKIYFEIIENGYVKEDNKGGLENRYKDILSNLNENINELQKINIKVGLDDYPKGNAYILLMYLENLDFVKIDKGILLGDNASTEKRKSIEELVSDIKQFQNNSEIIIEGVEDEKSVKILKEIGGLSMQGYYFGKPQKYI